MTIEKAVELGIPPLVFLNELQDLLTEEPEAPKKFLEVDGYQKLLSHLLSSDILVSKKILEILSDALQEKDTFVNLIIDSPETLTKITHLLIKHPNNNQIGILVYQFLCSLAEIPQSLGIDLDIQATLLCAINYYKSKSTEKRRFENMVENLRSGLVGKNLEEYEDTDNIYLPIIKLINSLIDDNELLEERIKLRNEFLLLGLDKIVDNLLGIDKIKESMLSDHLKAFKMSRESDNNKKLSSEMKVTMEQSESVQLLNEIMQHSQNSHIQNLLVNILQSLTKIPVHDKTGLPKWLLLDKIISDLCNQKNTITELINEGKINLEKGIEMEKLFLSSINEDKLTEELNTLKESYDLLVLSNEDLENRVMKKKEKIALIKAEHEEDIEEQRQQILEVDNYLEEYDQILEEYETNLLKTEEELQKTKNLLELKTIELTKYTEHFNGEVPRSKSFNETAKDEVTGIPKWKLQQQAMEKEIQERRERERAAKMLKVNTIRKRIKEMGHDAVDESNTIKGTPNSQLPIPAPDLPLPPPKPIGNLSRLKTNQTSSSPRTPTQKSLNISKLEEPKSPTHLSPHPQNPSFSPRTTTNPKEEELLLKLEKAKAKKKKFASQITKLEQEIGQQRMQILLLEKEKEARQRDEKRIQIKMQRVEEEKETVQRQRQTLQEDMKKLATQRDRITLDLKKEKQQVIKLKQELDTIRATYEEEKNVYLKDQEKLRKELEDKLEQITIERDLFETELMQEYMEEKDAAEKNQN
uniref:GBD/FH3 domain-containing protein n=1 Tax=Arcella intermedia TaxID=1963864 RepID=A0A6B2KY58_9EUKA